MGFGPSFLQWVRLLFTGVQDCNNANGYLSPFSLSFLVVFAKIVLCLPCCMMCFRKFLIFEPIHVSQTFLFLGLRRPVRPFLNTLMIHHPLLTPIMLCLTSTPGSRQHLEQSWMSLNVRGSGKAPNHGCWKSGKLYPLDNNIQPIKSLSSRKKKSLHKAWIAWRLNILRINRYPGRCHSDLLSLA